MKASKLTLPAVAGVVVGLVLVMGHAGGTNLRDDGRMVETAPTPYSADHAVAQRRGSEDTGAPTF